MPERFDAIVIGGGPAGSTSALLLARAGWSVALLERKPFPRRKVCGEYLSATNLPLFDALGLGAIFRDLAGPPVTKVGVFAGSAALEAPLPAEHGDWGRALAREHLDGWLLDEARRAGTHVLQPADVDGWHREGPEVAIRSGERELRAEIVIAAHGSWEPGPLPTQLPHATVRADDLLGFKAHFENADLPAGLMPLLAFPGGYGGMVRGAGDVVSLSCCIRRDALEAARRRCPGPAGDAVLAHIEERTRRLASVLRGARRLGGWLAAGPIRPGVRLRTPSGFFVVGNAAGEAHPVIAEGISMAMQSAWLCTQRLFLRTPLEVASRGYAGDWRRAFLPRLRTSQMLAQWAMRPMARAATMPLLAGCPAILTWFARLSGKASRTA